MDILIVLILAILWEVTTTVVPFVVLIFVVGLFFHGVLGVMKDL